MKDLVNPCNTQGLMYRSRSLEYTTMMNLTGNLRISALLCLLISAFLSSCGSDGAGSSPATNPAPVDPSTNPVQVPDPPETPVQPPVSGAFPFSGTITLDEYDWFGTSDYLGVIDVTLSPLTKRRLLDGSQPRRHSTGAIVYRQPCGSRVHRILVATPDLASTRQITPCSSELANPGVSPTNFGLSALSPDQQLLAVEAVYFLDSQFRVTTAVYNTNDQSLVSFWDNLASPMWLHDGRLLLSSGEGFYTASVGQDVPDRLPDGLTSSVSNSALHPTDDVIAFEYNQQIWLMNSDGTKAREAIYGGSRLRYPTWSPDGKALAYLSLPNSDYYDEAIYFTDLETQTSYSLDLNPVMSSLNASATVNGPLSWYR